MKVLQLGKFYPIRGGVEKVMRDLAEGLGTCGVSCDMLCASLPGTVPDEADMSRSDKVGRDIVISLGDNARIICVPALAFVAATMIAPELIFRLRQMLRKAEKESCPYNFIHIHHPDPMAALALMLSGYKGKVVLHWHSDVLKQKTLLKFIMPLQKWLIHRADLIVGTTEVYVRNSPHLTTVQNKLACLPIGIRAFSSSGGGNTCQTEEEVREKYGQNKRLIFSLGRLIGYKGFEYLVDAAEHLGEEYCILIGGSGPLRYELQHRIEEKGLSDRVHLLGRVPDTDLPAYFKACDLFVLSSIWKTEAFAIVQVEAMSCGKPVVATKIPGSGVSWVNEDGVSGINVPVCDSLAIAEAVKSILENPVDYARYSEGAKARYETVFSYEKMIEGCKSIYASLLDDEN